MEPDPTVTAVRAPYVSAWGGIQSAGQFVGQVALPYFTDWLGRKWALYIIWIIVVGVSDSYSSLPDGQSVFIESFVSSWQMWLGAKLLAGVGVGAMQATVRTSPRPRSHAHDLGPDVHLGAFAISTSWLFDQRLLVVVRGWPAHGTGGTSAAQRDSPARLQGRHLHSVGDDWTLGGYLCLATRITL